MRLSWNRLGFWVPVVIVVRFEQDVRAVSMISSSVPPCLEGSICLGEALWRFCLAHLVVLGRVIWFLARGCLVGHRRFCLRGL